MDGVCTKSTATVNKGHPRERQHSHGFYRQVVFI